MMVSAIGSAIGSQESPEAFVPRLTQAPTVTNAASDPPTATAPPKTSTEPSVTKTVTSPRRVSQSAPSTKRTTPRPPPSTASRTLDPRFRTCKQAKAAGYGPYRRGVDPEYDWYRDGDADGIVCEP